MSLREWWMWFLGHPKKPEAYDRECLNKNVREVVHHHRNVATKAIRESRLAAKVAEKSLRVSNEAMKALEDARRRDEDNIKNAS